MLTDVLHVLLRARSAERVVVFTACDEVMEVAKPLGFEIVREKVVDGHSAAVNEMVEEMSAVAPAYFPSRAISHALRHPISTLPSKQRPSRSR
jgi:hypothetical protein